MTTTLDGAAVDAECVAAAEGAARLCADLGHEVAVAAPAIDVEALVWAMDVIIADYARALVVIHTVGRRLGEFFLDFDVSLSPTLADPPLPLGASDQMGDDLQAYNDRLMGHIPFTPLYNIAGNPAMTVPLHWSADGLPVGAHFGAAFGDEATLLRLAAQLEDARPWFDRRPVM